MYIINQKCSVISINKGLHIIAKQSYSTPGIIYNINYTYEINIIIDITLNNNIVFFWNNSSDNKRIYLNNGINNLNIKSISKFNKFGILFTKPIIDNYFIINNISFNNCFINYNINDIIIINDLNVFLMNLDSRNDRLKKMNILLNSHDIKYTRFAAINGKDFESEFNKLNNSKISSIGAYGNLLSNIQIVQQAKCKQLSYLTIFEDDLFFHKNFNHIIKTINDIPNNWNIIYLGSSQKVGTIHKIKKNKNYYKANQSRGTFAYIIKFNIYDELIDIWERFNMNADMALEFIQNKHNCYVMWENLIIADLTNSDIQNTRNMKLYADKFCWNLDLYLMSPNITIILPVYNGSNYLLECINSILNQNYYYYQLIIVNDCSTDNTINIINEIIDDRIVIINNNKNMGIAESLNIGLKNTKTEFVTWISHDNYYYKNAINNMINALYCSDSNIIIAGHNKIDKYNNIIKCIQPKIYNSFIDVLFNFNGMCCFIFKTNIINNIGYYDNNLDGVEDWDFLIRIMEIYPFSNNIINETLCVYRCHPEQKSVSLDKTDLINKLATKIINKHPNIHKNDKFINYLKNTKNIHLKNYFNNYLYNTT